MTDVWFMHAPCDEQNHIFCSIITVLTAMLTPPLVGSRPCLNAEQAMEGQTTLNET